MTPDRGFFLLKTRRAYELAALVQLTGAKYGQFGSGSDVQVEELYSRPGYSRLWLSRQAYEMCRTNDWCG